MRFVRPVAAVAAALLAATLASTSTGASASTSTNVNANATPEASKCTVRVPGAEHLIGACLADLTTAGTIASGHTDKNDWLGLEAPGAVAPSGVKGIQLDGYFPDSSTTNTNHGWNHDSQFVIRLPDHWNGGLVVAGPPGLREQYANDRLISDHVLAKGYAYAATDKGNTGERIYTDGKRPGDAVAEWNDRVTELTVAARRTVARHYGRMPANTFMAGASAGGYLVRWQLENHPELYTGGVELHGLLLTPDSPNVLDTAPAALRAIRAPPSATRPPWRRCTPPAIPPRPGRCGSGTTATCGTRSSGSCARRSTRATTGAGRPGSRSARRGRRRAATPTTSTQTGRTACAGRSSACR